MDFVTTLVTTWLAWDVHINSVYSLEAMVLKVIFFKGDRHGNTNREVSKNTEPAVVDWSGEGEIVTELMDGQEEVVVEKRAKEVGHP
ncbi:hypothetical protein ACFX2I_036692 [Malus domestica]